MVILMSVWVPAAQSQDRLAESGVQATALLKLAASEADDDVEEVVTKSADEATKAVTKSAEDAAKAVTKSTQKSAHRIAESG